jgi:hypothetical protein
MTRCGKAAWLALVLVGAALLGWGEAGTALSPVLQVDYSNPGLSSSHWNLTLYPDGTGHFRSDRRNRVADTSQGEAPDNDRVIQAPDVDRDVRVSAKFADHVFQTVRKHDLFKSGCESHLKVAFQGWKELSYSGPEGTGSCKFNYSKDKDIQTLGDSLVAVAETIMEGARLETLLQHDRLGLDSEMEYLVEAAKDGRTQEIRTIRGILDRLAADPDVMERVRKRARLLLAGIGK